MKLRDFLSVNISEGSNKKDDPSLLNVEKLKSKKEDDEDIEHQPGSETTQVEATKTSYAKAASLLLPLIQPGARVLDYGAGLGSGTNAMRSVLTDIAQVDSYEPEPKRAKSKPTFTKSSEITEQYDAVVCLNVLNVLPPNIRDRVVKHIGKLLKTGGMAVIGVRGYRDDIDRTKNFEPGDEPGSVWILRPGGRIYQKGFDGNELIEYVVSILGPGFDAKKVPNLTKTAVMITKTSKPKKKSSDIVSESVQSGQVLTDFLKFAVQKLELQQLPKIKFQKNFATSHPTAFGYFDPHTDHIVLVLDKRHPMDIMRTLAHELVHYVQRLNNELEDHSGETGSEHENQANAAAGILMRDFGKTHPEYFHSNDKQLSETDMLDPVGRHSILRSPKLKSMLKFPHKTMPLSGHEGIQLNIIDQGLIKELVATNEVHGEIDIVAWVKFEVKRKSWQVKNVHVTPEYGNLNLGARIYKEVAQHFGVIITSDLGQTPEGKSIWYRHNGTPGLEKIGIKPRLFDYYKQKYIKGDPKTAYNSSNKNLVLAFDLKQRISDPEEQL